MKKRLIAMLVVLTMLVCFFSVSAYADACTAEAVSITGTRGRPAGVSGGDTYYAIYSDRTFWVSWSRTSNHTAIRMIQGYLHIDGRFMQYNNEYASINTNVDDCVDGYFGDVTSQCIRLYQYRHDLTVDGDAGTGTWRNMAYYNYGTGIGHLLPYDDPLR